MYLQCYALNSWIDPKSWIFLLVPCLNIYNSSLAGHLQFTYQKSEKQAKSKSRKEAKLERLLKTDNTKFEKADTSFKVFELQI